MKQYLLGLDIGTGSCKCCLVDLDGNLAGNAEQEYTPRSVRPGWVEQDPHDWYQAVRRALQQLQQCTGIALRQVAAVGTAGQMRGLTLLDAGGRPVRPSILWNDLRCEQEVREIKNNAADLLQRITHNPLNTMCTLPKVVWMIRNEPENWAKTAAIIFPKDYVNYRLTGSIQTDLSDASGSSFYDIRQQTWADEILEQFGIAPQKLPAIAPATQVIGQIHRKAADETGLRQGVPVIAGGSDATVELFAVGVSNPTQCKIRLGTSGALSTVVDDLEHFPPGDYYCWSYLLPDHWMIDLNTRACAHSTVWLREVFFQDKPAISDTYAEIAREAQQIALGSEGLVFHPYLLGEDAPYWNPNLRGSFFGVTAGHTRRHFARAVFEGTAYALRDARSVIATIAQHFSEYIFVGGGVKNPLWVSIVADVLGVNGAIATQTDTALGAAMLAGIGAGCFAGVEDAAAKCRTLEGKTVRYDESNHRAYSKLFEQYVQMKKVYDQIYQIGNTTAD